jgi:hypothetical protein
MKQLIRRNFRTSHQITASLTIKEILFVNSKLSFFTCSSSSSSSSSQYSFVFFIYESDRLRIPESFKSKVKHEKAIKYFCFFIIFSSGHMRILFVLIYNDCMYLN